MVHEIGVIWNRHATYHKVVEQTKYMNQYYYIVEQQFPSQALGL
jgi:hypothetical protein